MGKDLLSGLRSFPRAAQAAAAAAGQFSASGKRPYTEVEKEESELGLNTKQKKYLKFQKRFQRKSCKWSWPRWPVVGPSQSGGAFVQAQDKRLLSFVSSPLQSQRTLA